MVLDEEPTITGIHLPRESNNRKGFREAISPDYLNSNSTILRSPNTDYKRTGKQMSQRTIAIPVTMVRITLNLFRLYQNRRIFNLRR